MKVLSWLKKGILLSVTFYLLAIAAIWVDGATSHYETSDYAIVLGNQVHPSGEPSQRLKARLLCAASLYNEGSAKQIIVSGGIGKEGHDEAVVMQHFLMSKGIPNDKIIVDSNGYTTRMTAQNTHRLVTNKEAAPIIVVSQLYHLSRTKMAFRQAGFKQVGAAYADYFERRDIYASLREVAAWGKYWLK
jgi:vancomycin permeability regulator SanA